MQEPFVVKKVAVLGAGVMGAQIAAHCVNAGIETLLFDLESNDKNHNTIVDKSISNLLKLKPSPLATSQTASLLKACNYADNLPELTQCDLIIEAIAERLEWKEALYKRISPYLKPLSILVSNTSGLSINKLVEVLPKENRHQFCGVHFFNPPRYMHLAELIPATTTAPTLLDNLESWLTRYLGKGVVRAKDTPNFIANRIGVFSLLATLHHAERFELGLDEVDALTGGLLGRPKSATFRTMDVVGLDTMQHVVQTMAEHLTQDPWHKLFNLPMWLSGLIQQGHLGQKTGQGIYRKNGKAIEVYDIQLNDYREANGVVCDEVKTIMQLPEAHERMQRLSLSESRQGQFLFACFCDLFHYAAFHLEAIADTVRDVDLAMQWGFGWQEGPFKTWQTIGIHAMLEWIEKALTIQKANCSAALPVWLKQLPAFYSEAGAFSPSAQALKQASSLPVYRRQASFQSSILFENEGICLSELPDDMMTVHFKSKANTISQVVIDGLNEALNIAEQRAQGLIIHQKDANNFSSGADLRGVAHLIQTNHVDALDAMLTQFQQLVLRFKYSMIPTVAALRGRALGGGCELMMQCSRTVAAFESYPGLVEIGVGLIPAGGGCKEMAMRAATSAQKGELMAYIKAYFEQIATAIVAGNAKDAQVRGYLATTDSWVMHSNEVLYTAIAQIKAMQAANYLPAIPSTFAVAGREGHALLQTGLVNWLEGGFISEYDYFLANQLAYVLCGGDVVQGTLVDEAWMLRLEKQTFMALAANPLTQARIAHLLTTGKPLRN